MKSLRALCTALFLVACQAPAAVGTPCSHASDCASPLVCAYGVCRVQCRETRDCPIATRCIASQGGGVCTLDLEQHCTGNVCPSPLVCSSDVCRTACTTGMDCIGGSCTSGTCDEPMNGADAGTDAASTADANVTDANATDANVRDTSTDAGIDAGGCALHAAADQTWATGIFAYDELAIATSETGTGASIAGTVHIAAMGSRIEAGLDAGPGTAFVLEGAPTDAAPSMVIDLHTAFGLVTPSSVALSRLPTGDVAVLALFDRSDQTSIAFGAVGTIAAGPSATATRIAFVCPEPTCTNASTMTHSSGRAAIAYRVELPRYVYRSRFASSAFTLAALDTATTTVATANMHVPQTDPVGEIASAHGSIVAMYDDASTGAIALWDMTAPATPPQLVTGATAPAGMATPQSRPAIATIGSNRIALVYSTTDGTLAGYLATCLTGACDVVAASTDVLVTDPDGSASLPVATEISGGFALAWMVHTAAGDSVHVATYRAPAASPVEETGRTMLFQTPDTSRVVVDVQLQTVHVGNAVHLVAAILERPAVTGLPSRMDTIRVVDITTSSCP